MTAEGERTMPVLADVPLDMVQRLDQQVQPGFQVTEVAGLDGDVLQRSSRASHLMCIAGMLSGPEATTSLETLQSTASSGAEVTFTADIVTALNLQQVVITSLRVAQVPGPSQYHYEIELAESPPLPPPAQVSAFGGLGDFGFGDLGFDTDILGDITDLAGDIAGAVDTALGAIDALSALAGLADLSVDGLLQPIDDVMSGLESIGGSFRGAADALGEVFGS